MAVEGHEERFPAARPNGRCRIQKRSVAADDWRRRLLSQVLSVAWDAKERRRERQRRANLAEQSRRDNIITSLQRLWTQRYVAAFTVAMTDEELAGFYSERQITFFNQELEKMGLTWRYPFERVE